MKPLVKLNGEDFVPQNNAALRALAIMLRLYDTTNADEAYAADVVLAHYEDFITQARKIAKLKSIAKGDSDVLKLRDLLERMLILIDGKMKQNNWTHIAGNNLRTADFAVFYIYCQYALNRNFSCQAIMYEVFHSFKELSKYVSSKSKEFNSEHQQQ